PMPLRFAPLVAVLVLAALARAQEKKRDVTVDDYSSVDLVTELAASPDGKHIAYCQLRWHKSTDDRKADLWVVRTDAGGKPVRLAADRANDRHPRWAADGKSVYVLANRKRAAE